MRRTWRQRLRRVSGSVCVLLVARRPLRYVCAPPFIIVFMTAAAADSSQTLCPNASVSFSSRCAPHASPASPASANREACSAALVPKLAYVFEQAAAQQPATADDVIAASITQLFYELDVEMIKATGTLSGCCCVAAAYAAPLMIVVSCGDCRSLFAVVWISRVAVTFRGAGPSSAAWTTSATA